jgi:hypothetical protein
MKTCTLALIVASFALLQETQAESVTCDSNPSSRDRSLLQTQREAAHRWWWDDLVQVLSPDSTDKKENKAKKETDTKDKKEKDKKEKDQKEKDTKDKKDKKDKDTKDKKEKDTKDEKEKDEKEKGKTVPSAPAATAGGGCGKQHVTPMFDSEDSLNALILQPLSTDLGFIHIPQNAGAKIESVGMRYGHKWGFNAINHTFIEKIQMKDNTLCSWFLVPPRYLPGVKAYSNKPLFCVTRDPTERLFATYLSVVKLLDRECPISQKDHAILSKYELCSPASLNYFVSEALGGSPHDFDCNLIPQNEYIWDWDGKRVCKEMFDFKELPTALPALLQKYNITLPKDLQLPSLLQATTNIKGSNESLCPGLTVADFNAESKLAIANYYKDDFEMLGYS